MSDEQALNARAIALLDRYDPEDGSEEQRRLAGEIHELLKSDGERLDDDVLITLLDLPPGTDTDPISAAATAELSCRGPGVVEALLTTALDGGDTAQPRALEILDGMGELDVVQGMIEVLGGDAQDFVKRAAVEALVAIGEGAAAALKSAAAAPRSQHLALAALDRLDVPYAPAMLNGPEEAEVWGDEEEVEADERDGGDASVEGDEGSDEAVAEASNEGADEAVAEEPDATADEEPGQAPDEAADDTTPDEEPQPPPAPDERAMDESYEGFLRDWRRRERP